MPDKKEFFSNLNMEDITYSDKYFTYGKKVWKDLKIKNLVEHHDFYVQSNMLLLADVFKNFQNKRLKLFKRDPAHFLSSL